MFRILTTLYNSEKYIGTTLHTVLAQKKEDWVCYVLNDLSEDRSDEIVNSFAEGDERIRHIKNERKFHQVGNYAQVMALDEIDDEDIVLTLDGDDWFSDDKVLNRLEEAYSDNNTWMTYGSFLHWHGPKQLTEGFAFPPEDFSRLREVRYTTTHLRTWKAFLWRKIKEEDLLRDDGSVITSGGDTAFMYPMLEMAGPDRAKFLGNINYIYNVETDSNVYKLRLQEQHDTADEIRSRTPYKKL